jgi:hypothetical protein
MKFKANMDIRKIENSFEKTITFFILASKYI